MWRATVGSVVAGAVLGGVAGGIAGAIGHGDLASKVGGLMGYLGSIPVSIWALKEALRLHRLEKAAEV